MRSGKVAEAVLKRSVLKDINYKAAVGMDAAEFAGADKMLAATTTVTLGDGFWGLCGVNRVAGDIACRGGVLKEVLVNITMPCKFDEKCLKEIMRQTRSECEKYDARIIGGHTEISDAVTRPTVSYTGIGIKKYSMDEKTFLGYNIVLTQWIGMEGAYLLTQYKRAELKNRYPAWMLDFTNSLKNYLAVDRMASIALENGAAYLHNLSNGGVFNALWEMSSYCRCGFEAELKSIPVRQEIIELAEFFEINPYQMLSGGCLLIVAPKDNNIINALAGEEFPAVVIGELTDSNDKIIRNDDEVRYLDAPQRDELWKVLDTYKNRR
jgi:hydrogenase maturation factor